MALEVDIRFILNPKEAFLPTLQSFLTHKFRFGIKKNGN